MQRAAVIGEGGTGRRALRALRGRGVEAVPLRIEADALVLLDAVRAAHADAVWPAALTAPLRAELSARCAGLGIAVIGPPAEALARAADPALLSRLAGASSRAPGTGARRIEAFVAAGGPAAARTLALSECLAPGLDEAPAVLSPPDAAAARSAAESACRAVGWRGLGIVQLALDEEGVAVCGISTGSCAEVAVEEATGLDLVEARLALHDGEPLPADLSTSRSAFSACLRVPAAAPASEVLVLRLGGGPGVRAEAYVGEGGRVAPGADVAVLCASSADRAEARRRLGRSLDECAVLVRGCASNRAAIRAALDPGAPAPTCNPALARMAAAIFEYQAAEELELERFLAQARRGRPRTEDATGRAFDLRDSAGRRRTRVARIGPGEFRVDGRMAGVELTGPHEARLTVEGKASSVLHSRGRDHFLEIDGVGHVVERDAGGVVAAPMPAVVQRILVQQGDAVEAGQQLLVLEAMKLEAAVVAPQAGRVERLMVSANQQVARDAPLLSLAPAAQAAAEEIREQLVPPGARDPAAELRRLLLGYDDDGWTASSLAAALQGAPEEAEDVEEDADVEALSTFAALAALFRRERDGDARPPLEELLRYLRTPDARGEGLPDAFLARLDAALLEQGASRSSPSRELDLALLRLWKARHRIEALVPAALGILEKRLGQRRPADARWRGLLERLITAVHASAPAIADLARELRFAWFDRPVFQEARDQVLLQAQADLRRLGEADDPDAVRRLVEVTWPLSTRLIETMVAARPASRSRLVEVLLRRYFRLRNLAGVATFDVGGLQGARADYQHKGLRFRLIACFASTGRAREACRQLARATADAPADVEIALELYLCDLPPSRSADDLSAHLREALEGAGFRRPVRRAACVVAGGDHAGCFTFRPAGSGYAEERHLRGVHPMLSKRLQLDRLANFELTRLPGADDVYLFHGRAKENARDERFFALGEVRDLTPLRDEQGRIAHLPQLEHVLHQACTALRLAQARRPGADRLEWNRILLTIPAPFTISREETMAIARRLAPDTEGLGLEMVLLSVRLPLADGSLRDMLVRIYNSDQQGVHIRWDEPAVQPLLPLGDYQQRVVQLRRRGLPYAYEVVKLFTPSPDASQGDFPPGDFVEHDLDEAGALAEVERPPGKNAARIVAGVVRSFTPRYPEGMKRVILLGDASREMGAVAEPECRRIVAAIDLAERLRVPLEWFTLSAGAQISLESGTENMDWVARALRRIVLFTQAGGEINVVVAGINVGAQPYWNAEATMLMHTRGILIMTPASAMVLTGKQALEVSGGVSAEDNQGIGGYDRIMGPNGQAQYWAPDLPRACALLLRHYEHTWVAPGERFPRRASSDDPRDRDVSQSPHPPTTGDFSTVGEIFSATRNPDRKKPFEIRAVMAAVADGDQAPLERWRDLRHGDTAVVWDAHLGGQPVCLLGVQSQTLPRAGFIPADGPDAWSGGTLFPLSSKKIARAINAASGNRPLVVLANLSGFDGSPESMRRLQLEYGAEIGRAVVNFDGPIVFCVVSRYHGGAFVVFSRWLRENMEVLAVEGARASVIGGAPAAAVVFTREVESRVRRDPRFAAASAAARARLRAEKMGEVAAEYDRVHTIERAVRVGSVERIVQPCQLRPALIDAVERGMARTPG